MGNQVPFYMVNLVSLYVLQAKQTLEFYSCTSEEIDHEDITKDKTSTVEACLPLELATVQRIFLPKLVIQIRAVHQASSSKNIHAPGVHHHGMLTGPNADV